MPGQFKHLAPALAQDGHEVLFLTQRDNVELPGVRRILYRPRRTARPRGHPYLIRGETAVLNGQEVARQLTTLREQGTIPDLVIAHPGWGESLFVKDVLPEARLISYCEFFYSGDGLDVGFDKEETTTLNSRARARARTMHFLAALEACDIGVSPTAWQRSAHPSAYQPKIRTIFDGIDTDRIAPDAQARFTLPNGMVLRPGDPIITYVSRNLEPYRGFRTFMRALPAMLARNPTAQVLIVGGDGLGYGGRPEGFATWREAMLAEVRCDLSRVHFLGNLPYGRFLSLLQVSAAHIYLTYPFVLSWSCFEAMAAGAVIIGSDTPPVREVIRPGENGLLVDFFDVEGLAETVTAVLAARPRYAPLGETARRTVLERYSRDRCLADWRDLIATTLSPPAARTGRRIFTLQPKKM